MKVSDGFSIRVMRRTWETLVEGLGGIRGQRETLTRFPEGRSGTVGVRVRLERGVRDSLVDTGTYG